MLDFAQQEQVLNYIPAFPVSPVKGAPQQMIGQGGLVASSRVVTTKTTTTVLSHTEVDKGKKKKKKF